MITLQQFSSSNVSSCPTSATPLGRGPPQHGLAQPPPQQQPSSCTRSSRHTQTRTQPPRARSQDRSQASQTSRVQRPIRPLFPPCPWKDGTFPPGPVRYLGPPLPTSKRTTRPRSTSTAKRRPGPPKSHTPAPISTGPTQYVPVIPMRPAEPLVTVLIDDDDDDDEHGDVMTVLPDKRSLNF